MRVLTCVLLVVLLAAADVPWGDADVMKAGGHRNLPGGMKLSVISLGEGATVALGPQSRRLQVGETLDIGSYRVNLVSVHDDRCVVKWVRCPGMNQALDLLEAYKWKVQGQAEDSTLEVPAELSGPAFSHYQWASQRLGLDLRLATGKKVMLRKYRLEAVTANAYQVSAYLAAYEGRIVGAWLATDGPVAPGIASLDQRDILQW